MLTRIIKKSLYIVLVTILIISSINYDVFAGEIVGGESVIEEQVIEETAPEEEIFIEEEPSEDFIEIETENAVSEEVPGGFHFIPGNIDIPGECDFESLGEVIGDDELSLMGALPEKYITPNLPATRNQNPYGTCWAHTTMALCEIGQAAASKDYSELQMAYFSWNTPVDPIGGFAGDTNYRANFANGGNVSLSKNIMASWIGATDEENMPYADLSDVLNKKKTVDEDCAYLKDEVHLQYYYKAKPKSDPEGTKCLIKDYGAVSLAYYVMSNNDGTLDMTYYNTENNALYTDVDMHVTNHAVTIVGWDDNFSKDNFNIGHRPDNDGAWLIRNSWMVERNFDESRLNPYSYFWMSYEDKNIEDVSYAFVTESKDNYDNNYQYDGSAVDLILNSGFTDTFANVFTANQCDKGETLKAVSFATNKAKVSYTIKVYVNVQNEPSTGTLVSEATTEGKTSYAGYYTVRLKNGVELDKGEKYAVVVTLSDGANVIIEGKCSNSEYECRASIAEGTSFVQIDKDWYDLCSVNLNSAPWGNTAGNLRIKAFTVNNTGITVEFDTNASEAVCAEKSKKVTFESPYGTLPTPTRKGYSFDGWYTAQTGGTKIEKTTKVTTAADHTLYAHWSGIKYTITFNKNASDATCNTASKQVTFGNEYGELPAPTRTGYDFEGWYTLASGGNKVIETTSVETASNHTLYAHWTACKYTVTFDKNASDATCNTASKQVTFGNEYGELPAPTRTGYEFAGWYTSQTGGTKVEQTSNVKTASNHTLYARWNGYKYTVTFDKNASDVTCNTASKQVTFGSAYGTLPTPTRTGYDFSGWYTDSAAGNAITSESIVSVLSNHTLYAHWKACEYTVIFDKNASDAECSQTNKQVTYKNTYGELPVPERPGYTFAGWYTSAMGGDLIEADTIVSKTASHRLYARWNGNKYKVCFDQNGADDQSVPAFKEVTYGGTYGDLPIPLRKGYDFAGWYTDSVAGEEIYATTKVPNVSEHTLHAHWMERRGDVTEADTEYLKKKQNGDTSIPEGLWISGIEDGYTYSGSAIKPAVRIFDGDKLLTEKVDYTLTYKNNVNVGNETSCNSKGVSIAPKVVATGKGNYKGVAEEMFNIVPKSIEDPEDIVISDPASAICNNKDQKPVPTVTYGKKKLAVKKDYTVSYYDNTEFTPGSEVIPKTPGTYYVLIEAVPGGNYTGSSYKTFVIAEADKILISKATIQKIKDKPYTGYDVIPDDDEIIVKMGKNVLKKDTDYEVSYPDADYVSPGTVNVKIVGKGNYIGSKSTSYKITGIPMKKVTIGGFKNSVTYDGTEKEQDLEVTYKSDPLELVPDTVSCEITYLNNINAGTATMILTGTNGYTGTIKKTFKIKPYAGDFSRASLDDLSFPYEKSGVKPDVTVSFINGLEEVLLTQGLDYTVSYSNNTAVNDGSNAKKVPTVKITGKGNFKGINRSISFAIEPASLKDSNQGIVINAADKVYSNKAGGWKQTVSVIDGKGKKLALKTDYTIEYTYKEDACVVNGKTKLEEIREAGSVVGSNDIVPAGTVINVTVSGTGKTYLAGEADSITESYRIVQKDFSKLKASVIKKDRPYTGSEIRITKNDISWTGERPSDDDFEIIGYKNNINKGTATVILKANDDSNYGGTKNLTFAIGTKAFAWWLWQ